MIAHVLPFQGWWSRLVDRAIDSCLDKNGWQWKSCCPENPIVDVLKHVRKQRRKESDSTVTHVKSSRTGLGQESLKKWTRSRLRAQIEAESHPQAHTGNVCSSWRLEALSVQFRYSVMCTEVLLDSSLFIVPSSYDFALVTVAYPWYWNRDSHMWWASCVNSSVSYKNHENTGNDYILRNTSFFSDGRWTWFFPSLFVLVKNSFISSSCIHLSQTKWIGNFFLCVKINCVPHLLSRLDNHWHVWNWKLIALSTSTSVFSLFLGLRRNGQYFPSESHRVIIVFSWLQYFYDVTGHRSFLLFLSR